MLAGTYLGRVKISIKILKANIISLILSGAVILSSKPVLAGPSKDFFKNLKGCFSVDFRYVEDGKHDQTIDGLYEWITTLPGQSDTVIQHVGIVQGKAFKHWREEWTERGDGIWNQKVIGPFEDLRYECSAPLELNQWRCSVKNAPKPRRDKDRLDYTTLDRENTVQSTPKWVVQAENNIKRDKDGRAISKELGWNEYRRVDESYCQAAKAFMENIQNNKPTS